MLVIETGTRTRAYLYLRELPLSGTADGICYSASKCKSVEQILQYDVQYLLDLLVPRLRESQGVRGVL